MDLLDADALAPHVECMDAVLHLAAIPSLGRPPNAEIFQINTASTFNVFDACAYYGIKRVSVLVWSMESAIFSAQCHSKSTIYPQMKTTVNCRRTPILLLSR